MLFLQTTSTIMFAFRLRALSVSAVIVVANTTTNQQIHQYQMGMRVLFDDDCVVFSNAISDRNFLLLRCRCCFCFFLINRFLLLTRYVWPGRIIWLFSHFFFTSSRAASLCVCACDPRSTTKTTKFKARQVYFLLLNCDCWCLPSFDAFQVLID